MLLRQPVAKLSLPEGYISQRSMPSSAYA